VPENTLKSNGLLRTVRGHFIGRGEGGRWATAGATIVALFRAEASKLVVIIGALWLVLTTYKSVTLPAFFAAFLITVLLFRVALLVRD